MQQIKKSSLNNSLIIVISSLLTSYFFIQVYPIEQRAVDAGLVLAGFVNSNLTSAHIAQSVEHFHGKEEVVCSIHTVGTKKIML